MISNDERLAELLAEFGQDPEEAGVVIRQTALDVLAFENQLIELYRRQPSTKDEAVEIDQQVETIAHQQTGPYEQLVHLTGIDPRTRNPLEVAQ